MKSVRLFLVTLLLAVTPALAAGSDDKKVVEKSFSFVGDRDIPVGITFGDVKIKSFRIRNWPDRDNFEKAEKDLNDTHTMVVEFTYDNRDLDHGYKCKYVVTVPGGKDGKPFAENDRTASLDKGKVGDTNRMFLKMRTNDYKVAKTIRITFEIWKK